MRETLSGSVIEVRLRSLRKASVPTEESLLPSAKTTFWRLKQWYMDQSERLVTPAATSSSLMESRYWAQGTSPAPANE